MDALVFAQQGVHRVAQLADSFPVNEPKLANAFCVAGANEFQDGVFDILWAESMKI